MTFRMTNFSWVFWYPNLVPCRYGELGMDSWYPRSLSVDTEPTSEPNAVWVYPLLGQPHEFTHNGWLVLWNMNFIVLIILGIILPFDFHIVQRGWNHQPDGVLSQDLGTFSRNLEWLLGRSSYSEDHPSQCFYEKWLLDSVKGPGLYQL